MLLANQSDEDILKITNPIMDNLMEGSTEIDHVKHTRDFTDRMKRIVTKEHLEKVCRRYQAEWAIFQRENLWPSFGALPLSPSCGSDGARNRMESSSPN
jgi:hypothetical protein